MVSYYGYKLVSSGQLDDRRLQKANRLCVGSDCRTVEFADCPLCGSKSLRKNISGKLYCGQCKKVIS
jgi:hypothetical protein